jgi:hypothetical protein
MNLRKALFELARAIADEAERNADLRSRIERALMLDRSVARHESPTEATKRKGGRRTPAILDPIELARQGESSLRAGLARLTLEQLRDVVAEYGMDPGKLVMKWKDQSRVVDRIVELALARATKGDAFRSD